MLCAARCGSVLPSSRRCTVSSGIVFEGTWNTEGSFMSFQIPRIPIFTKSAYCDPHQSRARVSVKSGNTEGPGQTTPTNCDPSALWMNTSSFVPELYGRSEERRVGKEYRSRCRAYEEEDN